MTMNNTIINLDHIKKLTRTKIGFIEKILFYVFRFEKKIIFENLHLVFKDNLSKNEKRIFAMHYIQHIIRFCKSLFLLVLDPKKIQRVEVNLSSSFIEHLKQGKGAVLVCTHSGSWEVGLLHGLALAEPLKNKLVVIKKKQNPLIQVLLKRVYSPFKVQVIEQKNSLLKCVKSLQKGKVVLIVHDSKAKRNAKLATKIDFLGRPVSTYITPAKLAKLVKVPIFCAKSFYTKTHHVAEIVDSIDPDSRSVEEVTRDINAILGSYIMQNPAQWMRWNYRRWD